MFSESSIHKQSLRKKVRELRKQISEQEALSAANNFSRNLASQISYTNASKIACFLSFDGELNTQPTIEMLLREKSVCYLPKIRPMKENGLWFLPYKDKTLLENNRFGIPEVNLLPNHAVAVSELDIILIPLVAFDHQGNRLGMGGGYYDATLAHLADSQERQFGRRPLYIGVAYEQQKVESIPSESWDVKLDCVLTQERSYEFS